MTKRRLFLAVLCLLLSGFSVTPVLAAEGRQARFSISMEVGAAFFNLVRQQLKARPGADKAELELLDELQIPGNCEIPSVTGVLYFSAGRLRMDLNLPGDEIATLIVDQQAGTLQLIDHQTRTAHVAELTQFAREQLGRGGMLVNPEMAALDWDTFLAEVRSSKGLKSRELGSRSVSGLNCRGLELSATLGELTDAQELTAVPELPAQINPQSRWTGTMWLAEGLPVPVKFSSELLGLSCIWQLLEVSQWRGSEAFLTAPPGYRVLPLDMSLFQTATDSSEPLSTAADE